MLELYDARGASRDWWGAKASPIAEPGRKSDRRASLTPQHAAFRRCAVMSNWLSVLQQKFLHAVFICHTPMQCKPVDKEKAVQKTLNPTLMHP
jgi:hypothetical protein